MTSFNSKTELHVNYVITQFMEAQDRVVLSRVIPILYIFNDETIISLFFPDMAEEIDSVTWLTRNQ